jgi:hypothetical protein
MEIEDFMYEGTEFSEEPELSLPIGAQWGLVNKNKGLVIFLFFQVL